MHRREEEREIRIENIMDENSDTSDSYYSAGSADDSQVQTRPNRFHGYVSTWRRHTENDRAIKTSLDRERNEDLSIHLYNAHALKRRVRETKDKVILILLCLLIVRG